MMLPLEESSVNETPTLVKCIDVVIEELIHEDLLDNTLRGCSEADNEESIQCVADIGDSPLQDVPRDLSTFNYI